MHRIALAILAFLMCPFSVMAVSPAPVGSYIPLAPGLQAAQQSLRVPSARVEYESAGLRFNKPIYFSFEGFLHESELNARIAFNTLDDEFISSMEEFLSSDPSIDAVESTEESFPDIGDDQYAAMIQVTSSGLSFMNGLVAVRYGEMIVVGVATGLGGNMFEALEPFLIDILERIDDTRIENSDDILTIMPRLAEMPPGFIVAAGA